MERPAVMRLCPGFVPMDVPILWVCIFSRLACFRWNLRPSQQYQELALCTQSAGVPGDNFDRLQRNSATSAAILPRGRPATACVLHRFAGRDAFPPAGACSEDCEPVLLPTG